MVHTIFVQFQGAAEPPEVELFMIANDMKILGNIRVIPGEESR